MEENLELFPVSSSEVTSNQGHLGTGRNSSGNESIRRSKREPKTLRMGQVFSQRGIHPLDILRIMPLNVPYFIENHGVAIEMPYAWPENVSREFAMRYFCRQGVPGTEAETSIRSFLHRVCHTLRAWGETSKKFSPEEGEIFESEILTLLMDRKIRFEESFFENLGLYREYGIESPITVFQYDFRKGKAREMTETEAPILSMERVSFRFETWMQFWTRKQTRKTLAHPRIRFRNAEIFLDRTFDEIASSSVFEVLEQTAKSEQTLLHLIIDTDSASLGRGIEALKSLSESRWLHPVLAISRSESESTWKRKLEWLEPFSRASLRWKDVGSQSLIRFPDSVTSSAAINLGKYATRLGHVDFAGLRQTVKLLLFSLELAHERMGHLLPQLSESTQLFQPMRLEISNFGGLYRALPECDRTLLAETVSAYVSLCALDSDHSRMGGTAAIEYLGKLETTYSSAEMEPLRRLLREIGEWMHDLAVNRVEVALWDEPKGSFFFESDPSTPKDRLAASRFCLGGLDTSDPFPMDRFSEIYSRGLRTFAGRQE